METEAASSAFFFADPTIWLLLGFLVLMYLMIIRPQNKRNREHKQMVSSLQEGDEVIAAGGLVGVIRQISEQYVLLEVGNGVQVRIQRTAVSHQLPRGTIKAN